jgi:hypothetical protein
MGANHVAIQSFDIVGVIGTQWHLCDQHRHVTQCHQFNGWKQLRRHSVGDQIFHRLLSGLRISDANDGAIIFRTDDEFAKATTVLMRESGPDKSRLYSRVFDSGPITLP